MRCLTRSGLVPQNAHALFEYQRQELVRCTKPLFGVTKLRLAGIPHLDQGSHSIDHRHHHLRYKARKKDNFQALSG
jgi:hypothetical protein